MFDCGFVCHYILCNHVPTSANGFSFSKTLFILFLFELFKFTIKEIIATLKTAFVAIFSSTLRKNGDYKEFYKELNDLFRTYKEYLVPLVCESRHPGFAKWYMDNQREMFKDDIGLDRYRTDKRKNQIINIALSGIIEEQVQPFGYGELSIDESFDLEYGLLQNGLFETLADRFHITVSSV